MDVRGVRLLQSRRHGCGSLMQCPVCGGGTRVMTTRTEAKAAKDPGLVRAGRRALARLGRRGETFVVRVRLCPRGVCGWRGKTVEVLALPSTVPSTLDSGWQRKPS